VQLHLENKFIMGQRENLQKSAVIHMIGSLRSNRSAAGATAIAARKIIILTVFAAVQ
jgi:hypothetical protein